MKNLLFLLPFLLQHVIAKPYVRIDADDPNNDQKNIESCDSLIYCRGKLLDTIQMARLFNDSKTFVDLSQKNNAETTYANFEALMAKTNDKPTEEDLRKFVDENFESENEITAWTPRDYKENPAFLNNITNADVKKFAHALVKIWPQLGKKVIDDVKENPDKHSIMPLPNGFIIPGGRFKELYYWDTYWIMEGLLLSEMPDTVKGMLENYIYQIKTYGLIPNGARVYYINRSQPPMFSLMVSIYMEATNDTDWLKENIKYVEGELNFWLKNRVTVVEKGGTKYKLAHYAVTNNTPRPESYVEDVHTCGYFKDGKEKKKCYRSLKSGAESGMDFSSRWFFPPADRAGNLTFIDTPRSTPVDVNALLCQSFKHLSDFYGMLGDADNQAAWLEKSKTWEKAIHEVLYDEEDGIWYDYDNEKLESRKLFYPTNFAPLYTQSYDQTKKDVYGKKAAKYFKDKKVDQFLGGIPPSLDDTGEQWDLPAAWPPHQDFVVSGLLKTGNEDAVKLATELGKRWVSANMKGFENSGVMYEKYDAINPGQYGGGGEYHVQSGFGWTNGIALKFMNLFYSGN